MAQENELGMLVAQLIEQQKEFQEDMKAELAALKAENQKLKENYLLAEQEARTNAQARAEEAQNAVINQYQANLGNLIIAANNASNDGRLAVSEAEYAAKKFKWACVTACISFAALIVGWAFTLTNIFEQVNHMASQNATILNDCNTLISQLNEKLNAQLAPVTTTATSFDYSGFYYSLIAPVVLVIGAVLLFRFLYTR